MTHFTIKGLMTTQRNNYQEISSFLNDMFKRRVIDETTIKSLLPEVVRLSQFYLLPKIRKSSNLGRLIVSSCGAPLERISWFMDYHLHPLVEKLLSYIRETTDFLLKLRTIKNLPPNSLLVTLRRSHLFTQSFRMMKG